MYIVNLLFILDNIDTLPIVLNRHMKHKKTLVFLSALFLILLIIVGNIYSTEEVVSTDTAASTSGEDAPPLTPIESTMLPPPAEATTPLPSAEATIPLPPAESTAPLPSIEFTAPLPSSEGIFFIQMPVAKKAVSVGMDKCRQCHTGPSVQWDNTIHAKWKPGFVKTAKIEVKKIECETCHGPGSLHAEDTNNRLYIISFGPKSKDTRAAQNAVCLNCHEKEGLYYWKGAAHGRNLSCTDCHHVMDNLSGRGLLNDTSERDICLKCHVQKKKDILRSPHLSHDEAKMTCSTCHAPHGSDTPGSLTSSSVNENCFKCHAEKRGPYLFDHLPVQENCLLCHDPHSSVNRALLKMRQPFLCLECHSNLPRTQTDPTKPHYMPDAHDVLNPKSRYAYNKGCTNCHPMIHGSRHPSGARLQR